MVGERAVVVFSFLENLEIPQGKRDRNWRFSPFRTENSQPLPIRFFLHMKTLWQWFDLYYFKDRSRTGRDIL